MKQLFLTALIVLLTLSFAGCKDKEKDLDITSGTKWEQAVKEYPFLGNFPSYDYDYQGVYQKVVGVETYMVVDRSAEEMRYTGYISKLEKAGFEFDREIAEKAVNYTKTTDAGETLEAYLNYMPNCLSITLSLEPKEW